ncbi:hypothetical protein EGW08_008447 [Elysia chlorotica]|uniref:Fibrinogen C-terminal domain-containing protein n=1 Tax=Elysia chlorotica TaxID=188477 RepID=A0A433TQB2_ELYCH|nr:hypothetical protein EGW08_008447 [Elysia chlorotica]
MMKWGLCTTIVLYWVFLHHGHAQPLDEDTKKLIDEMFEEQTATLLEDFQRQLEIFDRSVYEQLEGFNYNVLNKLKLEHSDKLFPTECTKGMYVDPSFFPPPYVEISDVNPGVLCDYVTDGGGWIIIQKRPSVFTSFDRSWEEYKNGFGTFSEEYYMGNERIHEMTNRAQFELRIDLGYGEDLQYSQYASFKLGDESEGYTLMIGAFQPESTGIDFFQNLDGTKFSTKDRDNDENKSGNCAMLDKGGWWYTTCVGGTLSLNGRFQASDYGLNFREMKIREITAV